MLACAFIYQVTVSARVAAASTRCGRVHLLWMCAVSLVTVGARVVVANVTHLPGTYSFCGDYVHVCIFNVKVSCAICFCMPFLSSSSV